MHDNRKLVLSIGSVPIFTDFYCFLIRSSFNLSYHRITEAFDSLKRPSQLSSFVKMASFLEDEFFDKNLGNGHHYSVI